MRVARSLGVAILLTAAAFARADSVMQWTFDANNQGWAPSFGAADGTGTTWVSSGGNPGGYVHSSDSFDSAAWHFDLSPTPSIGNVSAALDGTLSFDLKATGATGTLAGVGGNIRDTYDVALVGHGITLMVDRGIAPTGNWATYSVGLDDAAGWMRINGAGQVAATEDDIRQVLSNLTSVSIRGGYYTGHDVTGLDNVSFNASEVPLPASALSGAVLVAGYAAVLRGRRSSIAGR